MLKSTFRNVALSAVALALVATTTACKSEDVAVVGGAIAIVAGAVAIDSALDSHHDRHDRDDRYRPNPPRPGRCYEYRDRYGRIRSSCPGRYSVAVPAAIAENLTVSSLAEKYGIPLESAERLTKILQSAHKGDASGLKAMGLSDSELMRVARYQMPSEAALDQIGSTLAMSREMARSLVEQLMDETRAQMSDINSPAWQSCMATGKWKTDANGGTCKSADWTGCSPATGASICGAVL